MPYYTHSIVISAETHALIQSKAQFDWHETGTRLADGRWRIPLQRSTYEALVARQFPGESFDDLIVRIIAQYDNAIN